MAQIPDEPGGRADIAIEVLSRLLQFIMLVLYYALVLVGWVVQFGGQLWRQGRAYQRDPHTREQWARMWNIGADAFRHGTGQSLGKHDT